jgi:hypothetical protein
MEFGFGAMTKKKAKKTGTKSAKATPKRRSARKKPKDVVQVRQEIAEIVKGSANEITEALVDQAIHGQSAQAKYLFEVAKIYPAVEGEDATQEEDCLAKLLLDKLQPPKKSAEEESDEEIGNTDEVNKPEAKTGAENEAPAQAESTLVV